MGFTQFILDDHQEQRRLFSILEQLDRTDAKNLAAMWKRLAAFLEVHAEAETRPAARGARRAVTHRGGGDQGRD